MDLPKTINGFRLHNPNFLNIKIGIRCLIKKFEKGPLYEERGRFYFCLTYYGFVLGKTIIQSMVGLSGDRKNGFNHSQRNNEPKGWDDRVYVSAGQNVPVSQ